MDDLMKAADTLASSGETEGAAAKKKIEGLRDQWNLVLTLTSQRIKLGMGYVIFHKKAQQLAIQMDALEQYLKIEKIDATQIPESSIKHKEVKYNEMSEHYSEVENKGRTFIDEAQRVSDAKCHYIWYKCQYIWYKCFAWYHYQFTSTLIYLS